jgi:hypothetical protein
MKKALRGLIPEGLLIWGLNKIYLFKWYKNPSLEKRIHMHIQHIHIMFAAKVRRIVVVMFLIFLFLNFLIKKSPENFGALQFFNV